MFLGFSVVGGVCIWAICNVGELRRRIGKRVIKNVQNKIDILYMRKYCHGTMECVSGIGYGNQSCNTGI